jgi:tRNA modification GTPase
MNPQLPGDTIAGISTPLGIGGIGVIRISGPQALAIADRLFSRKSGHSRLLSHRIHLGEIVDPETRAVLDEVFLVPMRAPRTYTREDLVEIQCHSGSLILRRILEAVLRAGARLAAPGEFTKRAFLNGRIDLTQAEAVIDLLNSRTQRSLELADRQRSGALGREVYKIKDEVADLLALLEAQIDFPEEDAETSPGEIAGRFRDALGRLASLLRTYAEGRLYREGISAVIIGRPNVGKSSLLNCLLQEERAIVTAVPGTTRDPIEEVVNLNGIPLTLIDTAGLRPAQDIIEEEGIRRTRDRLARADLAIWVVDGSEDLKPEDREILPQVRPARAVVALNKSDLPPGPSAAELPDLLSGTAVVPVSALRNTGIEALKEKVHSLILDGREETSAEVLVSNLRQKQALEEAHSALNQARESFAGNLSPEFTALDLQRALSALGELVGETTSEDILDRIFSRFCIGK